MCIMFCLHDSRSSSAWGGQKRALDPLEMQLLKVVSHQVILGTTLKPSGRVVHALSC